MESPSSWVLVLSKDRLRLADGVELTESGLVDRSGERLLLLNGSALDYVTLMDGNHSAGEIAEEVASRYEIDVEDAWSDLEMLIEKLDRNALVDVGAAAPGLDLHRRPRIRGADIQRWAGVLLTFSWLGGGIRPARRYRAAYSSLVRACLRAHRLAYAAIALIGAIVVLLIATGNIDPGGEVLRWTDWALIMSIPVLMPVTFFIGMFAHEAGHLLAIRHVGLKAYFVLVRGVNVGINHQRGHPSSERTVALAGPLCALATSLVLARLYEAAGLLDMLSFYAAGLGFVHLVSLLPWYADGRLAFPRRATPQEISVEHSR